MEYSAIGFSFFFARAVLGGSHCCPVVGWCLCTVHRKGQRRIIFNLSFTKYSRQAAHFRLTPLILIFFKPAPAGFFLPVFFDNRRSRRVRPPLPDSPHVDEINVVAAQYRVAIGTLLEGLQGIGAKTEIIAPRQSQRRWHENNLMVRTVARSCRPWSTFSTACLFGLIALFESGPWLI